MTGEAAERLYFRRRHRISRDADFRAVYAEKIKKARGPLLVFIRANGLPEHRLGLAVGRRVGNAVARNRLKRLLREAFRHERHALPRPGELSGYDIVVSVRAHVPMPLSAYRESLAELVNRAHREHERRVRRAGSAAGGMPPAGEREPGT